MPKTFMLHLKANLVAYLALFVALGGSSYAAVRLTPGSVGTRALAKGAVTNANLAQNSVTSKNVANGSLTRADFKSGILGGTGAASAPAKHKAGATGPAGPQGEPGPTGPAGRNGGAYIGLTTRSTGAVGAPHGASTNVPLSGDTWTQQPGELDLLAGSVTVKTPPACTGSFGNALLINVDGKTTTFGVPPQIPASTSVTVPLLVGTLTEPASGAAHRITAAMSNSCTKDGEDFTVNDVKLDVLKFN
jgi:hypothetical protein